MFYSLRTNNLSAFTYAINALRKITPIRIKHAAIAMITGMMIAIVGTENRDPSINIPTTTVVASEISLLVDIFVTNSATELIRYTTESVT